MHPRRELKFTRSARGPVGVFWSAGVLVPSVCSLASLCRPRSSGSLGGSLNTIHHMHHSSTNLRKRTEPASNSVSCGYTSLHTTSFPSGSVVITSSRISAASARALPARASSPLRLTYTHRVRPMAPALHLTTYTAHPHLALNSFPGAKNPPQNVEHGIVRSYITVRSSIFFPNPFMVCIPAGHGHFIQTRTPVKHQVINDPRVLPPGVIEAHPRIGRVLNLRFSNGHTIKREALSPGIRQSPMNL